MTTWSLEDHVQNLNYHFFKNFENIKMDKIDFLKNTALNSKLSKFKIQIKIQIKIQNCLNVQSV